MSYLINFFINKPGKSLGEGEYALAKKLKELYRDDNISVDPFVPLEKDVKLMASVIKQHSYGPTRVEDLTKSLRKQYESR